VSNFALCWSCEAFVRLPLELLVEVLGHKDLEAGGELEAFKAAAHWVEGRRGRSGVQG
jgi:hypothetical protein